MNKTGFDYLTESGVKIIQSTDGYKFTSDAVALAKFANCKKGDVVIDAGCGGGVISLIINDKCKPGKIIAIDINPNAIILTTKNAELNSITNVEVHNADIREFYKTHGVNIADVIVCNPPYFSNGRRSTNKTRDQSRHDDTLSLDDLTGAAARLLKYGGALYLCYPARFLSRAIYVLEGKNFRTKNIKFLANNKGIYLALIHAKKGGGDGMTVTMN